MQGVTAAGCIRGIVRLGEQCGAPSPWIRWGLGMDQPKAHAQVSLLSWDLPGSSQPLNLSLSLGILGLSQCLRWEESHQLTPRLAGPQHLDPYPASSPCKDMEDDPNLRAR